MKMRRTALFLLSVMLSTGVIAEDWDVHRPWGASDQFSGLSVFLDAGLLLANNQHSMFYGGQEGNVNIYRIMHSQAYGENIWRLLVDQGRISPSAIHNYGELQVVESAHMFYKPACQLGFGFRYDYNNGMGWMVRFDYAKLTAAGAFNLSSTNGTGVLTDNNQYITCGIYGLEERINIDLALCDRIPLSSMLDLDVQVGFNFNNSKVEENKMEIGGAFFDILDYYGGRSPDMGFVPMEYINQGGIGYGGFATLALCYPLNASAATLGYTFYYNKITLEGYTAFAPQHVIFLRFDLNNFTFLD